jgi:hypothetical protein
VSVPTPTWRLSAINTSRQPLGDLPDIDHEVGEVLEEDAGVTLSTREATTLCDFAPRLIGIRQRDDGS